MKSTFWLKNKPKILITGSRGFLGKNFISFLKEKIRDCIILEYDVNNSLEELELFCKEADLVFHFAAIQRPVGSQNYSDNIYFTQYLLSLLEKNENRCQIVFASSIQAELDNDYGSSKRKEEEILFDFGNRAGNKIYAFRFPNMFGTMSKPNYTSVVSTFCYNISHNLPITINNAGTIMKLAFVGDIMRFVFCFLEKGESVNYPIYYDEATSISLAGLVFLIESIKANSCEKITFVDSSFIKNITFVYKWFEKVK